MPADAFAEFHTETPLAAAEPVAGDSPAPRFGGRLRASKRDKTAESRATAVHAAAAELAVAGDAVEAALAAGHAGVVTWQGNGQGSGQGEALTVSAGLGNMLGIAGQGGLTFDAILGAFDDAGRAEIGAAVERLRASGEGFSTIARSPDGKRYFQAVGRRGGSDAAPADVLWLQNITDRAAALVHLERQTKRLRNLIDAVPLPIWARDSSLRIADCNRAYVDAVEAEAPEAVFAECREFVEGDGAEKARNLARGALDSGAAQEGNHNIVVSGARRNYLIHEEPIAGGKMTAGFALDRTEVEDLRGELDRHQRSQEDILDRLALAIMVFGENGHLRFVNSAGAKLWQLDETWLGTNPEIGEVLDVLREKRLFPETGDFSALKAEWRSYLTKLIEPREELMHLPNGTAIWMVISPHPTGGLLITVEDVTDKLRLERSYNTLVDVQQATLNNLSEGVAVFGEDGCLRLTNPVFREMWGLDDEFVNLGPHLSEVVEACKDHFDYGDNWERFKTAYLGRIFGRVMRNGRINTTDDRVLAYSIVPMPDGGVLLSYRDITDSTRVERALRERNDALEAADRLKSEFVANVSYELRSPLTTILGFAEILNNQYFGELNDKQTEYLSSMIDASHKLQNLINDIIDLSVIEAGRMVLEITEFDLRELLDGLEQLIRARATERNVAVEVDCEDGIGTVQGDARRLRQVLYNLLLNAISFSEHGDTVRLSARRVGDELVLTVEDNGPGIAPSDRNRVFDPFVRGVAADRRYQGAGLGLSLVKRFIELHGGTVALDSEPSHGTRVTCTIPARQPEVTLSPGPDGEPRTLTPTRAAAE